MIFLMIKMMMMLMIMLTAILMVVSLWQWCWCWWCWQHGFKYDFHNIFDDGLSNILVLKEFQWWWRWRCFYQVVIVLSGKVSKPAKLVSISETGLNEESSGKRPLDLLQFQEKKFLWCWWFLSSLSDDPPTRQPGHLNIRKGAAASHFLKILVLKQNLLYQWLVVVVQNLSTICFKVSN